KAVHLSRGISGIDPHGRIRSPCQSRQPVLPGMVQSRNACHRHFESIQAARGGLLHLARFQHQCAGPEGSSHARALSRLGLGSDLRHRRQWWRLDRAPLYGTAASEAADSWCPVKPARQTSKLFAHDIALSNIIRGVKEVREWLPQAPLLICDCIPPLTTPSKSNNRRAEPISGSSLYWPDWARHDDLLGQREHECEAIRVQGRILSARAAFIVPARILYAGSAPSARSPAAARQ